MLLRFNGYIKNLSNQIRSVVPEINVYRLPKDKYRKSDIFFFKLCYNDCKYMNCIINITRRI